MVHAHPLARRLHQPRGAQLPEMMADRRFRERDGRRQITGVRAAVTLREQHDISFTRTGSASAFNRRATSSAARSSTGAAPTGAQQIGAETSIVGNAFGIPPS